jgi:hypothetical protein
MLLKRQDLLTGAPLTDQHSLGAPPERRLYSLRRTSAMQAHFPDGPNGSICFVGTGRDLYTGAYRDAPRECASERADIELTPDKRIARISNGRNDDVLAGFVGMRVSGELRSAFARDLREEVENTTLLFRLLDDLAGATFLSAAAWFSWFHGRLDEYEALLGVSAKLERGVEGLCISYTPGSPSILPDGRTNEAIAVHPVGPLPFSDDTYAWHDFALLDPPNQWRIRHSDLWFDGGMLRALIGFQDSAAVRGSADERRLFHEYRLTALIDPAGLILREIEVTPAILPFRTCLIAPDTAKAMIGHPIANFGALVPKILPGIAGCTHLNDVLRAMQDIVGMARTLFACDSARASTG